MFLFHIALNISVLKKIKNCINCLVFFNFLKLFFGFFRVFFFVCGCFLNSFDLIFSGCRDYVKIACYFHKF